MIKFAKQLFAGEDGATMVEYALMVALVAIATIAAVSGLGSALFFEFSVIAYNLYLALP